ncbi:DEAD/DEAH box helicase [Nonomuraea salmonea]|uniref:DEAD/DEAH box helicase n=1 Tax=Nonomuraea salmonea TaxID=46181 RepID=UPI003CD0859A
MALPLALSGQDLIGQARTGTGKTYAFGIAMLQSIGKPRKKTARSPAGWSSYRPASWPYRSAKTS